MVRILPVFFLSSAIALVAAVNATSKLPVIFVHGILTSWEFGHNFAANLTAEGREVVGLKFCDAQCSVESLLTQAHFFASPVDDAIMPWESSLFGRYTEVDTLDEIETAFMKRTVVNMTETTEYREDTFGLRTLDERGGLHLHVAPNVTHSCWCVNEKYCEWAPVYDQYIYPVLN